MGIFSRISEKMKKNSSILAGNIKNISKKVPGFTKSVFSYAWSIFQVGAARGHAAVTAVDRGLGLGKDRYGYYYLGILFSAALNFSRKFFKNSKYKYLNFLSRSSKHIEEGIRFIPLFVIAALTFDISNQPVLSSLFAASCLISISHRVLRTRIKNHAVAMGNPRNDGVVEEGFREGIANLRKSNVYYSERFFNYFLNPLVQMLSSVSQGALTKDMFRFFLAGLLDLGVISGEETVLESPWLYAFVILPMMLQLVNSFFIPLRMQNQVVLEGNRIPNESLSPELTSKELAQQYEKFVNSLGEGQEIAAYDAIFIAQTIGFLNPIPGWGADTPNSNPDGVVSDAQGMTIIGVSIFLGIIAAIKRAKEYEHKHEKMGQRASLHALHQPPAMPTTAPLSPPAPLLVVEREVDLPPKAQDANPKKSTGGMFSFFSSCFRWGRGRRVAMEDSTGSHAVPLASLDGRADEEANSSYLHSVQPQPTDPRSRRPSDDSQSSQGSAASGASYARLDTVVHRPQPPSP